jgi:RNA polymerase sigma factor (sigma-70 family)
MITSRQERKMAASSESHGWVLEAVDLYELPLQRYARRLVGDFDLAADAVQHAFLKLCEQSQATLDGRVAPWLFRVCRNKALDHLRHADRQQPLGDAVESAATRLHQGAAGIDPSEAAEARDLAGQIRTLVKDLPGPQREAIDLWCEGFTHKEIAGITGRTEGHIRVLVHRGLTALRQHPLVQRLLSNEAGSTDHTSEGRP